MQSGGTDPELNPPIAARRRRCPKGDPARRLLRIRCGIPRRAVSEHTSAADDLMSRNCSPRAHCMPANQLPITELSPDTLRLPIQGQNLEGAGRLEELLGDTATAKPTLLVFLRHFG